MLYYVDEGDVVRKISKISYVNPVTGVVEHISRIQDLDVGDVVRLLWSLITDLPSIGYWLNDKPWSNNVGWRNKPE